MTTKEDAIKTLERMKRETIDSLEIDVFKMAIDAIKAQDSIEQLTDTEQRIFLTAMAKEKEICKRVDKEYEKLPNREDNIINLVNVCHEIERKIKKVLWR